MGNETFKVGEIAVLAVTKFRHEYRGAEVEIIGGLKERRCWYPCPGQNEQHLLTYQIRRPDGTKSNVEPYQLRKRRPPQDWVKLCNLTDIPREVSHV